MPVLRSGTITEAVVKESPNPKIEPMTPVQPDQKLRTHAASPSSLSESGLGLGLSPNGNYTISGPFLRRARRNLESRSGLSAGPDEEKDNTSSGSWLALGIGFSTCSGSKPVRKSARLAPKLGLDGRDNIYNGDESTKKSGVKRLLVQYSNERLKKSRKEEAWDQNLSGSELLETKGVESLNSLGTLSEIARNVKEFEERLENQQKNGGSGFEKPVDDVTETSGSCSKRAKRSRDKGKAILDSGHIGSCSTRPKRSRDKGKAISDSGHIAVSFPGFTHFNQENERSQNQDIHSGSVLGKAIDNPLVILIEDEPEHEQIRQESWIDGSNNENEILFDNPKWNSRREANRQVARSVAERFARFQPEIEEVEREDHKEGEENWPGPFSTAYDLLDKRETELEARKQRLASRKTSGPSLINWVPSNKQEARVSKPPSLEQLCFGALSKNLEAVASLENWSNFPELFRNKFSKAAHKSRKMNSNIMGLLFSGCPSEIRVWDCSLVTQEELQSILGNFNGEELKVLQFDFCGRSMTDGLLQSITTGFPLLTNISIRGAYCLSDSGLDSLVSSTPSLRSINLSQCSFLSEVGIQTLVVKLGSVLRELYIDDCDQFDAKAILPSLKKIENLEVLSIVGLQNVSDRFISELMLSHGCCLKELGLARCRELTDKSIEYIAAYCNGLRALNLDNLLKLTDLAITSLTHGCTSSLEKLTLGHGVFSDEAVSTFVETRGNSLKDLSLSGVKQAGEQTALAMSRCCTKKLQRLDVSWCREMTDEALGLIADSCLYLRELRLFGCTEVTAKFLNGHSNPNLRIIGMNEPLFNYPPSMWESGEF
ncbi:hypothetical protein AMTRI_Chr04g242960 [Amborella trichopoda]